MCADRRDDDEKNRLKPIIGANDGASGIAILMHLSEIEVTLEKDEGVRPETNIEGLRSLKAVLGEDKTITAGNASQLSDGASACVIMDSKLAEKRNIEPLGIFRGLAVSGLEPDEMGIGPIYAVPRLLERNNLTMDDIDLWELNEAFAVQVIYSRDKLGIPNDKLNVNGGSIAVGHPYGMSGSRLVGHALIEGRRRNCPWLNKPLTNFATTTFAPLAFSSFSYGD